MISLDANVVLRFLLDDVPAQTQKATELIEKSAVYITDVVIVEAIYVLEKVMLLSRQDILALMKGFLGFANVTYNTYFLPEALELYGRRPGLSIVDCYAAAEAQIYKNSLATFDKRLVRQGGTHVHQL